MHFLELLQKLQPNHNFVNHHIIKKIKTKDETSEMDERYHDKFRNPEPKESAQKDD